MFWHNTPTFKPPGSELAVWRHSRPLNDETRSRLLLTVQPATPEASKLQPFITYLALLFNPEWEPHYDGVRGSGQKGSLESQLIAPTEASLRTLAPQIIIYLIGMETPNQLHLDF